MTEQEKREKVIEGFEKLREYADSKVHPVVSPDNWNIYSELRDLIDKAEKDTLALLKAQEPRVMTLEEVEQHNNQDGCVWFEQPTYNAVAAFVRKDDEDYTEIISPYLLGEPINHGYMANRFYGKAWRCWTSRPTDEQREAVKWE